MEEKVADAIEQIWRVSWFVLTLVLLHVGYYFYAGIGHWDTWGGISSFGLDTAGALTTSLVDQGEFWRLGTSIFLHAGVVHLVLNMLNLYCIGVIVEGIYGRLRLIVVYLSSGVAGSVLTWAFGTERTVGASGAIFGLIGLLLIFGWKYRRYLQGRSGVFFRRQLAFWTVVSLGLGVVIPMIDNAAHVGGLLCGIVYAMLFPPLRFIVDEQMSSHGME